MAELNTEAHPATSCANQMTRQLLRRGPGCGCSRYRSQAGHQGERPQAVCGRRPCSRRGDSPAARPRPRRVTDEHGSDVFGSVLYEGEAADSGTEAAIGASLGCGVPTAVADLHDGETVLDLGSGAGADVLISARRVGPTGKAIGLDMTDEMLVLARRNATTAGVENVEFVKGYLEQLPLADETVDVVISNCVINLSGDKPTRDPRSRSRATPGRPIRGLRRDRRPRHGRSDASRHGRLDRLHRRRPHRSRVPQRPPGRRPRGHRDPPDPPRSRARRRRDYSRPQAGRVTPKPSCTTRRRWIATRTPRPTVAGERPALICSHRHRGVVPLPVTRGARWPAPST